MKKNTFLRGFERFGRSFLLPVSVLPGAGIIMGIGTAFTNKTTLSMLPFLKNDIFQFIMQLFIKMGGVAFNNLPLIFAVGVAVGLTKREKGSAALSAVISFLTLHIILNFLLTKMGMLVDVSGMSSNDAKVALGQTMQTKVLGIQTMDLSVFGGIITGVFSYFINKMIIRIELPKILGFFNGPRLVPMASIIGMSFLSIFIFFIWQYVQIGISSLSNLILQSGYIGTFFYGVLERALLPFGLHHGLNWPVRTTEIGGTWMVCGEQISGTVNAYIASLNCQSIAHIDPSITRFNGGKFVYFMFGFAGAAYAMYKTSFLQNRKMAGSLLFAAAGTSFITGITEPIEFTFLFVSPILYAIHAVMAGLSLLVMHLLQSGVATPTGHGLINLIIYGVLQGSKTSWYLVPIVGLFGFLMYYIVFKWFILRFNVPTPGREEEVALATKKAARDKYGIKILKNAEENEENESRALALINAHGGVDNILDIDACITRLRVTVKNKEKVNSEFIKTKLGAMGFVESGNQMQSIYGAEANILKIEMQSILNIEE